VTGDLEVLLETGSVAAIEIAASSVANTGKPPGRCANCSKPLIGAYCAVCGQPTNVHRRTVFRLLHELFVDIINVDSRILRTLQALLFQPGELAKAFREGRTQRYLPAFRLYLFLTLIFFVLLSATGIAIVQLEVTTHGVPVIRDAKGRPFLANPAYDATDPDAKNLPKLIPVKNTARVRNNMVYSFSATTHFFSRIGAVRASLPPQIREDMLGTKSLKMDAKARSWIGRHVTGSLARVAGDPMALNGPLTVWIPRALFLLLPIYALLLGLFYLRQRKDYFLVDHLVFSLSIHSFAFVVLMAAVLLGQMFTGSAVAGVTFCIISLYIFLAMKNFYAQSWFKTGLKFVLLSGTYTIFFLLPSLAAIFVIAMFGENFG